MHEFAFLPQLFQDVCFSARQLQKAGVSSLIVVLSLALGIGANVAVFTVINAVLLRPLPVAHPAELFELARINDKGRAATSFNYPFYRQLLGANHSVLNGVLCQRGFDATISAGGQTRYITGELVSGNYFDVLGLSPYSGRLLHSYDETAAGADRVVVLSFGFWRLHFGGTPSIIGKQITLNNIPMTVVGVSPDSFQSLTTGFSPDVQVPITMWPALSGSEPNLRSPDHWWLNVICRLKPDVAAGRAASYLGGLYAHDSDTNPPERVSLLPAQRGLQSPVQKTAAQLYTLLAIVALVLLISCLNFASLFLARSAVRQRETAIRLCLGSGRLRVVRQQLAECGLMASLGAIAGILLAHWGAGVLFACLSASQPGLALDSSPDSRVIGFALLLTFATAMLLSFAPALQSMNLDLSMQLKAESSRLFGTRMMWRKLLVSAQIAMSLLLLVSSALFLLSLRQLRNVDVGFASHSLLAASMDPTLNGYNQNRVKSFYSEAAERVRAIPGVSGLTFARVGLMENRTWHSGLVIGGVAQTEKGPGPSWNTVGPEFFSTLRIPILQGRDFTTADDERSRHVAIVSKSFASFYFGPQNPIGHRIGPANAADPSDYEIVGIVADTKSSGFRETQSRAWYIPFAQHSNVADLTLYVRTMGDPVLAVPAVERTLRQIDPNVALYEVKTLDEQIGRYLSKDSTLAFASTLVGIIAAALSAMGLYGVISYAVVKRAPEIGIRLALGAQRGNIVGLVMREVFFTMGIGLAVGSVSAFVLSKYLASLLFQLRTTDARAWLSAALLMTAVAMIAGYLPARRAALTDPAVTLRSE